MIHQTALQLPRRGDGGKTICLVMIVRNEEAVIERCLRSVAPFTDYWVISDTGSTDHTKQLIAQRLDGIPGEFFDRPWVNFGHNRSLVVKQAAGKADYLLLMNADEVLNVHAEFRDRLVADLYHLRYQGNIDYHSPLLVRGDLDWRYEGVTHEYITCDAPIRGAKLPELSLTHFADGGTRNEKYHRDIDLLTKAVEREPKNPRYVFYLAQSYRDTGNFVRAMELYERRTQMSGWDEETWYAGYQAARMRHLIGMAWPLVLDAYLAAYSFRPSRLEPLYHIAKQCRANGEPELAYLYARSITETPYPDDLLFIERNIYEYLLPFECAQCCFAMGKKAEAVRISDELLARPDLPPQIREALVVLPGASHQTAGTTAVAVLHA